MWNSASRRKWRVLEPWEHGVLEPKPINKKPCSPGSMECLPKSKLSRNAFTSLELCAPGQYLSLFWASLVKRSFVHSLSYYGTVLGSGDVPQDR